MSEPVIDSGSILRDQSTQLAGRITNLENQIAASEGNISAWKNEKDAVTKAKGDIDGLIDKLPKQKVPAPAEQPTAGARAV